SLGQGCLPRAAPAVPVAVEAVRVVPDHAEVAIGNVLAVEVRRVGRDADVWVAWITVRRRGWRWGDRWLRRCRRRLHRNAEAATTAPEAEPSLARFARALDEEVAVTHVRRVGRGLGVTLLDQLFVEKAQAVWVRQPDIAQQPAVAVGVRHIALQQHAVAGARDHLARERRRLRAVAHHWL